MPEENDEFEEIGKEQESSSGRRPDLRVVQPIVDREGNQILKSVGGMWKNISKNGNEFYTLKIGDLRLLVFPNIPRE